MNKEILPFVNGTTDAWRDETEVYILFSNEKFITPLGATFEPLFNRIWDTGDVRRNRFYGYSQYDIILYKVTKYPSTFYFHSAKQL